MHVKREVYTKVEQFLRDDDFIRYVMDCLPDKDSYWASYLTATPQVRAAYLKAYDILLHLDDCDLLTPEQTQRLKQRIFNSLRTVVN
jgi:hypothetical protein